MKNNKLFIFLFIALILSSFFVLAVEQKDTLNNEENELVTSSGIEIDNLVTFVASIMALVLFGLVYAAYKRDGRKRLLYVAAAFLLFAIKGIMMTSDIFYPQKAGWVDLGASLLDFGILLSFFIGILKK